MQHTDRYERAQEFYDVVTADDAHVKDPETGI